MKKIALVAYQGELMCFSHVLLYALDYADKGYEVAVIVEGAATGLIKDLARPETPFAEQYRQVRERGLIACICKACSMKTGSHNEAQAQGLILGSDMHGHPSLEPYTAKGFTILTF